ncbi:hypothetical protein A5630_25305 [Mycolicibacterium mucogenicum]|uniref:DNA binding protein n=1 Tax=Mycolicibacterium mucogenicum TaxID=56689 RepID=A0A1A3GY22_MYCMU|nr:hypothetical protein [Mycolicibacterium mucogenicum]OBJ40271.1 hypothetical protein A5630_25305 [Mycolicibacterium mucogenicum]
MTIDSLAPLIRRAAKAVAHQWPGVIEKDDAEQAIYLRLLETKGSIQKIALMDKDAKYRAIIGIGHQLASEERTDYDYYKGAYRYSVKEVRRMLDDRILIDPPANFKAELLDIEAALGDLSERYHGALMDRYVSGLPAANDADQKALERAVDSLVDAMNRAQKRRHVTRDDGLGTRNQATTSDHYEANDFDFESFAQNQGIGWG